MDLAYVDKLAKHNRFEKSPLVRQDLFDRTVAANGMKTKDSKDTVQPFLTMITKKQSSQTNLGWQGNRICWRV